MLLVFAGEGPTDLGGSFGGEVKPGPMAWIVDYFVTKRFDYSPIECGLAYWISRGKLAEVCKADRLRPGFVMPGDKRQKGYTGYAKHAAALALVTTELEETERDVAIAVMFRDSDGSQSASPNHWESVVDAIESGFDAMGCSRGVAMVPKPKQEAWLLCALKEQPYQACHLLEEESGNDHAPMPLKDLLIAAVGYEPNTEAMCAWVQGGEIDLEQIDMPRYSRFIAALSVAMDRCVD